MSVYAALTAFRGWDGTPLGGGVPSRLGAPRDRCWYGGRRVHPQGERGETERADDQGAIVGPLPHDAARIRVGLDRAAPALDASRGGVRRGSVRATRTTRPAIEQEPRPAMRPATLPRDHDTRPAATSVRNTRSRSRIASVRPCGATGRHGRLKSGQRPKQRVELWADAGSNPARGTDRGRPLGAPPSGDGGQRLT